MRSDAKIIILLQSMTTTTVLISDNDSNGYIITRAFWVEGFIIIIVTIRINMTINKHATKNVKSCSENETHATNVFTTRTYTTYKFIIICKVHAFSIQFFFPVPLYFVCLLHTNNILYNRWAPLLNIRCDSLSTFDSLAMCSFEFLGIGTQRPYLITRKLFFLPEVAIQNSF